MRLLDVFTEETKSDIKLVGIIERSKTGEKEQVFFQYPIKFKDFIRISADSFLPVLLLPAMRNNEDLIIEPDLSNEIFKNQSIIQDIFANWYPDMFKKINVEVNQLVDFDKVNNHTAQFFSLGIDSFHTLIKNNNNDHRYIIFMEGLELPLSRYEEDQGQSVISKLRSVEENYNVTLIQGKTNFRDLFDLDWAKYYDGAGLSATAHSLSNGFGKIYIPSGHSYSALFPNGSSFWTDNLWSSKSLEIFHDGSEVGRSQKIIDYIVHDQFAYHNMRVCTENDGGNYNCCKCRKCLMTMLVLHIVDKLNDCNAFPSKDISNSFQKLETYNLSNLDLSKDVYNLSTRFKKFDIAKKIKREVLMGKHDVYGRNNSQKTVLKYFTEVVFYFTLKIKRKLIRVF